MFSCTACTKHFNTEQGREMHYQAKHKADCPVCGKQFRSVQSMNQHYDAVHQKDTDEESYESYESYESEESEYWPDDPVPTPGYWAYLCDFKGVKSFGYFKCESCDNHWISAHSFTKFKQGCSSCDSYWLPKLLWVNDRNTKKSTKQAELDTTKPHRTDLCEACQYYNHPCWK